MRFSKSYIPTLKESPSDADVISHKLLLRAGLVRRLTSGLYIYLPLGLKVLDRISRIVREEMEEAGVTELLLPMVQPADLWMETGRWSHYGKELLRFVDRNERPYCLGPTHEEVITDLVRRELKSYKQLPLRLFQIQTKFRDETRPRFGLMRGREFIMKDAYSFDVDEQAARQSYEVIKKAYMRIFSRLGLKFRAVEADTGSIGGNFSHEFMVLADAGEDTIAFCDACSFASNIERAEIKHETMVGREHSPLPEKVPTPHAHTVDQVSTFLDVAPSSVIKTMIYLADGSPVAVLVRGDREVNESKLKKFLNLEELSLADAATVEHVTGSAVGYAGPIGLNIPVYADQELEGGCEYITGANSQGFHMRHVDIARDVNVTAFADLRTIAAGDCCPRCGASISFRRGIEVGHIFMLGQKYSGPMHAVFLNAEGEEQTAVMGCYGIGISRIAAAAIEQNHDDNGIIFPPAIAPADCVLLNLDPRSPEVSAVADKLYERLRSLGFSVLYDDRDERPGVKFKDADLLGIPVQLILGKKSLNRNRIEFKVRSDGNKGEFPLDNFFTSFEDLMNEVKRQWESPDPL